MPARLITKVELYKDGHREVFHLKAEENEPGWRWTHPDTPRERKACTACASGTLESARELARQKGGIR